MKDLHLHLHLQSSSSIFIFTFEKKNNENLHFCIFKKHLRVANNAPDANGTKTPSPCKHSARCAPRTLQNTSSRRAPRAVTSGEETSAETPAKCLCMLLLRFGRSAIRFCVSCFLWPGPVHGYSAMRRRYFFISLSFSVFLRFGIKSCPPEMAKRLQCRRQDRAPGMDTLALADGTDCARYSAATLGSGPRSYASAIPRRP